MENLLRDENILLNQSISTQEEAIEKAGQLLVDSGVVKAGYVQAMKDREQIVSTFMGNALAIPHGTDEAKNEVIASGLSLLQIPEGLLWNGEEVKVVIGIAGKDGEHLDLLSQIAMTFSEEENIHKIVNAASPQAIRQVFEEADA
ncbi:PTS sugar transporter subunit IIA [Staphylococcus pseudintermedius]|uniref:Mannitol-specific phosphotransferase enzyme IIA component n=1 Tax=Staphylococcus pseudintermedius TaxID=283734 RepID=A0A2P4NHR2_STAPS|nr:PTS sugar transporter subunit IIA [Staphylococcus pseudintermedius]ADV06349.1 PTS system, mannitol-specific IIA component [Staphylococcus pseudintermedius HKU10-03]ANQ87742.1 PTS mannitol transporter subunit IIA [Staphylococcus pseudintermedius]ASQ50022.1 PTS mannitol transporter subunit IIA [Staphylococcus pseudintermedius]AYG56024.1 PTS mannitol transporter subunit IIA [Staphylococcus pseudintermedius]EGQ0296237.1 PTS sugar transporter subunit IIA [Staphylococcus pseudintermedius]